MKKRCGRNFEYYSEDPYVSGKMAAAITKGVQKHPGRATTIKHFACNNQETNRYFSNSIVSMRAMREIYLKGFEICVKESQPHFIMTSYNLINGEHACNWRYLLTDILRNEWGFKGVVMTDWLVTGGMGPRGEKWPCASAAGNVKARNDVTMPGIPSDKRDITDALHDPKHPYSLTRNDLLVCAKRVLSTGGDGSCVTVPAVLRPSFRLHLLWHFRIVKNISKTPWISKPSGRMSMCKDKHNTAAAGLEVTTVSRYGC